MKTVNKFAKALVYVLIMIITLIESYLIALLGTSIIASLTCAVWSFIAPLPAYISKYFGILLLQGTLPVSMGVMVYIIFHVRKQSKRLPEQKK